ncbi:HlyD family secretion protein [soil metagenome]
MTIELETKKAQDEIRPIEVLSAQSDSISDSSPATSAMPKKSRGAKVLQTLMLLGLTSAAVIGGTFAWNHFCAHQETDDAYLTGHIIPVSSRIEANVDQILVDDNEVVKQGQELVRLDPRDFARKVSEARAALERAKKEEVVASRNIFYADVSAQASSLNATGNVSSTDSGVDKAFAAIQEAKSSLLEQKSVLAKNEAELVRAKLDSKRYEELEREGAVTTSERDGAIRDLDVATANREGTLRVIAQKQSAIEGAIQQLKIAKAQQIQSQSTVRTAQATFVQATVTRSQRDVAEANIKEAEERLKTALLNLSYTSVKAPVSGRIGRKTVEVGQRLQPGGRLLTLTGEDIWVVANFKENQLERMKVGQSVEIKIDAMQHEKFEGVVDSFSPGSGAQFTLLPPDNATGNFTKITQRVPVKIRFKNKTFSIEKIVPGLSASVSVLVGN